MSLISLSEQLLAASCGDSSQSDFLRSFFRDAYRDSSLELTTALGKSLDLNEWNRVLEVPSDDGHGALYLHQTYRCQVIGIEPNEDRVGEARRMAFKNKLFDKITFRVATPDSLKERDGDFDALAGCLALSSASDKPLVASELRRVLRPGARLALAEVAVNPPLPPGLRPLTSTDAIGQALPIESYQSLLQHAGFQAIRQTDSSGILQNLVKKLQTRTLMARLAVTGDQFNVDLKASRQDLQGAQQLFASLSQAVEARQVGLAIITASA